MIKVIVDGRWLFDKDKLTEIDDITRGIRHFWEIVLELNQQNSEQYNSTAHSSSESRLQSDNSRMPKRDKRGTVQNRLAKDAKRVPKKCEKDCEETRLARQYRIEISSSMYAVQCQSAMALHAIVDLLVTRNVGQELPPPTAPKVPELPQFATCDSALSESDNSESSKEREHGTVSDVGESEVGESID